MEASDRVAEEADNFDEMAKNSYKKAFIRDLCGDAPAAAFWRGRARGLELAAINLRAGNLGPLKSGRAENENRP